MRRSAEATLTLVAILMLAILLMPWKEKATSSLLGPRRVEVVADPAATPETPMQVRPETIASLFTEEKVVTPPKPVEPAPPTPLPEPKKPVDTPWLKLIGSAIGPDGKHSYAFKDTRSTRVIKVSEGEVIDGWSVADVFEDKIVLEHDGGLYAVKMR
jgi:hypothetical protein